MTNINDKETNTVKSTEVGIECEVCGYPLKDKTELNNHMKKHKELVVEINASQNCGICDFQVSSNNEFRKHIQIRHTANFNCEMCDFQGSSKIILTKHMNLKHRLLNEQDSGTLKCTLCNEQYSSKWNMNNHTRDKHGKTETCRWFKIVCMGMEF